MKKTLLLLPVNILFLLSCSGEKAVVKNEVAKPEFKAKIIATYDYMTVENSAREYVGENNSYYVVSELRSMVPEYNGLKSILQKFIVENNQLKGTENFSLENDVMDRYLDSLGLIQLDDKGLLKGSISGKKKDSEFFNKNFDFKLKKSTDCSVNITGYDSTAVVNIKDSNGTLIDNIPISVGPTYDIRQYDIDDDGWNELLVYSYLENMSVQLKIIGFEKNE